MWLEGFEQAKAIADKIANSLHCDQGGSCPLFAELATKEFVFNGIKNFVVVEGWVKARNESYWRQHTWIEMEGQKIDPTFAQFNHLGEIKYVTRVKKRYSPGEYLSLCAKHPEELEYLQKFQKEWAFSDSGSTTRLHRVGSGSIPLRSTLESSDTHEWKEIR